MDDRYNITERSSADFPSLLDELISKAKFNPIYSSRFNSYYEEVFNNRSENLSLIVSKGQNPILGLLCSLDINKINKCEFEYLGRPAALISNPQVPTEVLLESTKSLIQHFAKNPINPFSLSTKEVFGSLRMNPSMILEVNHFQKLISRFGQSQTKFSRVINLKQDLDSLNQSYSKSVRSAIKAKLNAMDKVEIINNKSSNDSVSFAFESLKKLHFDSAGRKTRSDASWEIQELLLLQGDAFISQFRRNNEVISSAFFMYTKYAAYYGVSASIRNTTGISLSHLCILEAIKYCKENGIDCMHLGDQYSYLSGEISEKEKNIEKFKSFFGGGLVLEILLTK